MLWSATNISVIYRQDDGSLITALDSISLSISRGQRIAVMGANGSGKSTLALVIAGLITPTSGKILLNGVASETRSGALVFQSPDDNLIGATVRDELTICLEQLHAGPDLAEALNATLARFGLASISHRETSSLSGGEKQLVALMCAIASGHPLIVMDEPTSHLDPPGARLLWDNIEAIAKGSGSPPAIVIVTQYSHEVKHCDRLIVLDKGTITFDGAPQDRGTIQHTLTPACDITETHLGPVILSVGGLSQLPADPWPVPEYPLRDINLEIRAGEAVALCGPIGAGKTTMGLMLAGVIEHFSGTRACHSQRAAFVMQFPERQIFCNTVEEEVAYGIIASGVPGDEAIKRAHNALDEVRLDPEVFARRNPHTLSTGQKRRVMLAAAGILNAEIIIMDEPQASLDDDGVEALMSFIAAQLAHSHACVIISHDFAFLRSVTARALVLNRGNLVFDGSWDALDTSPNLLSDIGFQ